MDITLTFKYKNIAYIFTYHIYIYNYQKTKKNFALYL